MERVLVVRHWPAIGMRAEQRILSPLERSTQKHTAPAPATDVRCLRAFAHCLLALFCHVGFVSSSRYSDKHSILVMSTMHKRFTRKHANSSKKENRSSVKQAEPSLFLDSSDQSQALYYLGLTYHLRAKELLGSTGGLLNDEIRVLLNKAIVYYE